MIAGERPANLGRTPADGPGRPPTENPAPVRWARGAAHLAGQALSASGRRLGASVRRADLPVRAADALTRAADRARSVGAPTRSASATERAPSSRGTTSADTAQALTARRLAAAWRSTATGAVTVGAAAPVPPSGDATELRLVGALPTYSFDIGMDPTGLDALRVEASWSRSVPDPLLLLLRQAINDWNRERVWPTVWTSPAEGGRTVRAATRVNIAQGITDRQLTEYLDLSLASIDAFFTALDGAVPAGGDDPPPPDTG